MNIIHGFSTGFSWIRFHGVQTHENSLVYGFSMGKLFATAFHGYFITHEKTSNCNFHGYFIGEFHGNSMDQFSSSDSARKQC